MTRTSLRPGTWRSSVNAATTERMVAQAHAIGANAVLNIRFSTSSISQGAAELFAYGTAVVVE
ncbi:hypothetical protein D3C83_245080 [compost metagenome]